MTKKENITSKINEYLSNLQNQSKEDKIKFNSVKVLEAFKYVF